MIQIFIGSFVLSVIHASIPNHWLPLVAIGKSENWSRRETLTATAIAGFAHTASTILIGIGVGFLGFSLSEAYESTFRIIVPFILFGLGALYIISGLKHSHSHSHGTENVIRSNSKTAIITSISTAMFFSPCVEIEVYYLSAALVGWMGILTVSLVYLIVTIMGMLLLVDLGLKGVERLNWHFLEHYERSVTGAVLILLGILAYFVY